MSRLLSHVSLVTTVNVPMSCLRGIKGSYIMWHGSSHISVLCEGSCGTEVISDFRQTIVTGVKVLLPCLAEIKSHVSDVSRVEEDESYESYWRWFSI